MAGLARICKMYGGMTIQGVKWAWDYVADEAVPERDMPHGSERRKESERARAKLIADLLREPETESTIITVADGEVSAVESGPIVRGEG